MTSIFGSIFTGSLTIGQFILTIVASMFMGLILSAAFMYRNTYTKSFISALVLIPAVETVVIMLVNDNIGFGLSVAGSFALIRFRSVKGTAKELSAVFIAMTVGIICGAGYVALAGVFTLMLSVVMLALSLTGFGSVSENSRYLKITIPESLNYDEVFSKVLDKYCSSYELESIRTLTLGSLFRVEYSIRMNDVKECKAMIDELRTRNGNLEIMCGKPAGNREEL
ncbi:MAG: DUF4956 domain-containing protein [Erysipelotrichaceae bacterium]|nr:DUF4956 domain-containing protein [Erysipelotrichaceae bacterium]MBR2788007.1 DUF4956 domain-containing protein [Erysipelotrichaceae bacterium]